LQIWDLRPIRRQLQEMNLDSDLPPYPPPSASATPLRVQVLAAEPPPPSKELDAAALMIPLVGFLAAHDPRVLGTVATVERRLMRDGFVIRYDASSGVDGQASDEGAFLPCSCWLADCLALQGRDEDARELFERVLSVRNDVGLLSEEYGTASRRLLGNFPQAFSHVSLISTARNLSRGVVGPAERRRKLSLSRVRRPAAGAPS